MKKVRIHAYVSGKVQGVFFRYYTREFATKVGVTGWVRNLPDGRVEVVAEGNEDAVQKLIRFLHKGSPLSKVEKVEVKKEKYTGEFEDFRIRY
ncbi:MAG: acylphosphatase [Candidatus Aenigmarchaeota archaeon]|nr:acylphosphatase [Candidatus Aenigmarchaeota archaeon]